MSHVGKIYNVLTHVLATRIYSEISGLREIVVWLCSRIGEPVDRPQMASVQIRLQPDVTLANVAHRICTVVQEELERMPLFCEELAQGRYPIC